MKLLIISDLHFSETNDWVFINSVTEEMSHRVNRKLGSDKDEIAIAVLGDIIDRGGADNIDAKFTEAGIFIEKLKNCFPDAAFLFVPGNHEIRDGDITDFNSFCQPYNLHQDFIFTKENSVFSTNLAGINFILADTTLERHYDKDGKLDIEALKQCMRKGKNIILMHHPPYHQDGAEKVVKNSSELIATRSNFIFYGHQHGAVKVPDFLASDTDIHSVGTLLKQEEGASNEFLLLDISEGRINYAYRYIYNGVSFISNLIFPTKTDIKSEYIPIDAPIKSKVAIPRSVKKVSAPNDDKSDTFADLFTHDINNTIDKNRLLLLIGDAGIGKSFALSEIYWHYKDDEEYFPIFFSLKALNSSTIKKFLGYAQHNTVDRKNVMLIIDGLDEIQGDQVSEFLSDMGSVVVGNPELKVVLSTRTSFIVSLNEFSIFQLVPFSDNNIREYVSQCGISNIEDFFICCRSSDCMPLAYIPFYLKDIVRSYMETSTVPPANKMLDYMISLRFQDADKRHPNDYSRTLLANESKLRHILEELGFFMQAQHKYPLDNLSFTQFLSEFDRELLIKSGLVRCAENDGISTWDFEHNIFREYLTAKYLCDISFDELIRIISSDESENKSKPICVSLVSRILCKCAKQKDKSIDISHLQLRPSWVNIVAFLLSMRSSDDLKRWLIDNAKDVLCSFESDKLTSNERDQLFFAVLEDCSSKGLPIYSMYNDEKIARYFQSEKTITYMISLLQKSISNYDTLSILHILSNCDNVYGKEQALLEVLKPLVSTCVPENVVSFALKALANIYCDKTSEIVHILYSLAESDTRPGVVGAVCDLIKVSDVADEYAQYLFSKLNDFKSYSENFSVREAVSGAVKCFKVPENVVRCIDWCCRSREHRSYYRLDNLLSDLVFNAHLLIQQGRNEVFDGLLNPFLFVLSKNDKQKSDIFKRFYATFKMLPYAFNQMLKIKMAPVEMMFLIEGIMDESLVDVLISSYQENEIDKEVYIWYAQRLPQDSLIFLKLNAVAKSIDGQEICREPTIDWVKIQSSGKQIYFDSLFNSTKYNALVVELVGILRQDITCGQVLEESMHKVPHDRVELQNIETDLYHWGDHELLALDFVKSLDWDVFSISAICRALKNYETISVSADQHLAIKTYFNQITDEISFDQLPESVHDDPVSYAHAKRVIFLMQKLGYTCTDDKLLEMLMLPWYYFASSTSTGESEPLNFVSERIANYDKLSFTIRNNIRGNAIPNHALHAHIRFCLENNLLDAVKMASEIVCSTADNLKWVKNSAADYLIAVKGSKFVDSFVDKISDLDFLRYLASHMENDNANLTTKLLHENALSDDRMLFLAELIRLNNRPALERYYELAKNINSLPGMHNDDGHIPEAVMSIRDITDINLAEILFKLLELSYSDGFRDRSSFGLKDSLIQVMQTMIRTDAQHIQSLLKLTIQRNSENEKLKAICNWHLNDIDKQTSASNDFPWSAERTMAFIRQRRIYRV